MLVTTWNMLTNGEFYSRDPGPDYYTRRVPAKTTKARAVSQLESLGYRVRHPRTNHPHRITNTP